MRFTIILVIVLVLFQAENSHGLNKFQHKNQKSAVLEEQPKFKIIVTHIKFDYKGGDRNKSDALNIRKKYGENNDLEHKGNGVGSGEWNYEGRNEPALYVANQNVKIKVRFTVVPSSIHRADIEAKAVRGLLLNIVKKPVQFINGKSSPEYVLFEFDGPTSSSISKIIDFWQWKASNVNKSGSPSADLTLTGPHTIYTVLKTPKAPWYQSDNNHHPWVTALEFSSTTVGANGITHLRDAADTITDFVHSRHGLIYSSKDMGGSKYFKLEKTKKKAPYVRGLFNLTNFIRAKSKFVNCQDTTAAVHSLVNLLGGNSKFAHRTNFGYLNVLNLIGVGDSNNPFFNHPGIVSHKMVPINNLALDANSDGLIDRSFFNFHTYVIFNGKVYDSTIGPFKRYSERVYKNIVIDHSTLQEAIKTRGSEIFSIPLKLK